MIDQNLNARSQVTSEIQMEKNHCYIKKARVLSLFTYNTKHRIRNYHFFHKTTLAKQDKLIQCLHKWYIKQKGNFGLKFIPIPHISKQ